MSYELLAPAGSFEIARRALYEGADAIYLACESFGARAYAKNLTFEELEDIVNIANVLNKKIYVTVNTLIKDEELDEVKKLLHKIYEIGVHAVIATDFAVINYVINNLPDFECHISTQVGVKNLEDIKFFDLLKAKRCVLARETNLEEIKKIKQNSKMPIEVFIHGSLCVSYSGNCFISSMLTLRSGNRGRCSQNCRYEYEIIRDEEIIGKKANYLSMKDLNSYPLINELRDLGVDSFKIEGRMKDEAYVANVIRSYRNKLDNLNTFNNLDRVFHREYTKGFLANEENGNVVYSKRPGNIGQYVGTIKPLSNNTYELNLKEEVALKDRIRVVLDNRDYYFNIETLTSPNNKPLQKAKERCYTNVYEPILKEAPIYKVKDINLKIDEAPLTYRIGLDLFVTAKLNKPLEIKTIVNNKEIIAYSDSVLVEAMKQPLTEDTITKQLEKFSLEAFYLKKINFDLEPNLFMVVKELNSARRNLIKAIYDAFKEKRTVNSDKELTFKKYDLKKKIIAKCHTKEQYEVLTDLGIECFYDKNYLSYNSTKYQTEVNDILVSNYGAFYNNMSKSLTLDYHFNVLNHESLARFLVLGVEHVTLSKELTCDGVTNLVTNFKNKFNFLPPVDFIVYGHTTLMTLKYCPIKHIGHCPECKTHQFYLKDSTTAFPLIHEGCITHLLNSKATNLIDDLKAYYPYIDRFRLDFTIEDKKETRRVALMFLERINNLDSKKKYFNSKTETRGYHKRNIL